jgi:hypothetical protein
MLTPGRISTLTWSLGGDRLGSITLAAQQDGVRLLYRMKDDNGAPVEVNELVRFAFTATRFGGQRQWFRCLKCHQRCRKIYGGRYFRCRRCYRLRYASQSEDVSQRALRRADKIAKRLHDMWRGTTVEEYEFPPKPPRMRWGTYRRLEQQFDRLQDRWGVTVMARFGRRCAYASAAACTPCKPGENSEAA